MHQQVRAINIPVEWPGEAAKLDQGVSANVAAPPTPQAGTLTRPKRMRNQRRAARSGRAWKFRSMHRMELAFHADAHNMFG